MIEFLRDEHRRHLALTALVAVGLALYLTGVLKSVLGFDPALLLALVGGFPIYYKAKIEGAVHAGAKDALLRYLNERAAHHIIFTVEADEA